MRRPLAFAFLAALLLAGCAKKTPPSMDAAHYLDAIVDTTADPRKDFNAFAVGKWLKNNPIPANERSWGIAHVVQEETYRRLIELNEEAARGHAAAGSNAQKLGDFWAAAMDSQAAARQGMTPLAAEFARIDSVQDLDGLLATIAHLKHMGVGGLMAMPIYQDE